MPSFFEPTTSGSLASLFNGIVSATAEVNGSAEDPRAVMVFSSLFRRKVLQDIRSRQDKLGELRLRENILVSGAGFTGLDALTSTSFAQQTGPIETEIRDLRGQLAGALPNVSMEVNPHSIDFDQPKRFARQDTVRGSVFHHFTNDKGQNNDILTLTFQGSTGNISLRGSTPDEIQRSKRRLIVWENLYHLTREPMLLSNGTQNEFYVTYMSALFPVDITFTGFFSRVLKFSEKAEKPNSRDYSMEFTVTSVDPDLDDILSLSTSILTGETVATPTAESRILTQ